MISIITGGARSGKSEFAESLIQDDACYIATAKIYDKEMEDRVRIHQKRREKSGIKWSLKECYTDFSNFSCSETYILLDCLTIFSSNVMFEITNNKIIDDKLIAKTIEEIVEKVKYLIDYSRKEEKNLIIVTNELGSSIIPENKIARVYRDIAGLVNKEVTKLCDHAYLVVMGIEVKLK